MNKIYNESCITGLPKLPEKSVQMCVTSPPYFGLRQYLFDGAVVIKDDISQDDFLYLVSELERLNINPDIGK